MNNKRCTFQQCALFFYTNNVQLVDFVFEQTGKVATNKVAEDDDDVARQVFGAQFGRSHHHVEGIGYGVVEAEKDEEWDAEQDEKEVLVASTLYDDGHYQSATYGIEETMEKVGRETVLYDWGAIDYVGIEHKTQKDTAYYIAQEYHYHLHVFLTFQKVDEACRTSVERQFEVDDGKESESEHTCSDYSAELDKDCATKGDTNTCKDATDKYVFHNSDICGERYDIYYNVSVLSAVFLKKSYHRKGATVAFLYKIVLNQSISSSGS